MAWARGAMLHQSSRMEKPRLGPPCQALSSQGWELEEASLPGSSSGRTLTVFSRILRLGYKTFKGEQRIPALAGPRMSLESLFEHILCTEHQAEESRRVMQEVKSEVAKCCEKIKKATERLNGEKIQLEDKAQKHSEKSCLLQLLKTHENALEKQYSEMENQKSKLLQILENTKKNLAEEEAAFLKEIADFNNEFEITKNWELLMKENAEMEISGLENEAKDLKSEIKSLKCDQLNELQKEKSELLQELSTLQKKLKVLKDEENEAICTTKYLEAEKIKIKEKPQNDAECLRLQKELELYKEDDMGSVCEALQTEIEILESTLAQKNLQGNK